jgi:hypothetical protein
MKKTILILFLIISNIIFANTININHNTAFNKWMGQTPIVSENGEFYAAYSYGMVKIWNKHGKIVTTFIDPDPHRIYSKEFKYWKHKRDIFSIAFSHDNKSIYISSFMDRLIQIDFNGKIIKKRIFGSIKAEDGMDYRSQFSIIQFFNDGKRIVTKRYAGLDVVDVRDENWEILETISMKDSSHYASSATVSDIKISPDQKHFAIVHTPIPSQDGWNANIRLFDRDGNYLRDLNNDRMGKVKTVDGKFKRKFLQHFKKVDFSKDGKNLLFVEKGNFKDPLKRTTVSTGWSKRKIKVEWEGKVRIVNVSTGKQREVWLPKEAYGFKRVIFSKDSKFLYALHEQKITKYNTDGKFLEEFKHEGVGKRKRSFYSSDFVISPKKDQILGTYSKDMFFYKLDGSIINAIKPNKFKLNRVNISKNCKTMVFEKEHMKMSFILNSKSNKLEEFNGTVIFDHENKKITAYYDRKRRQTIFNINNQDVELDKSDFKTYYLKPFQNRTIGYFYRGFIVLDEEGEALKRYPKLGLNNIYHPKFDSYIEPNFDAKYKTVYMKKMNGKLIKNIYVGADMLTLDFSFDGNSFVGGHTSSGHINIWNSKGDLEKEIKNIHSSGIKAIALSNNSRFLLSYDETNNIIVSDLKKNRTLNLTLIEENGFVASSSDSYFYCTNGNEDYITVSKDGEDVTEKEWKKRYKKDLLKTFFK